MVNHNCYVNCYANEFVWQWCVVRVLLLNWGLTLGCDFIVTETISKNLRHNGCNVYGGRCKVHGMSITLEVVFN